MSSPDLPLTRRALVLGAASVAGLGLSGGASRLGLWPAPQAGLDSSAQLERLYASLDEGQRALVCLPADHPSRQVTNTSPILRRPHLGSFLDAEQRALVHGLARSMLSGAGLTRFAPTLAVEAGGLEGCALVVYGRPGERSFQASINGGHFHLRTPSGHAGGVAFGGAIAWGQQKGNGRFKVEGNAFAFQSDLANAVYAALPAAQRAEARVAGRIDEHVLQVQSHGGRFPGLAARAMSEAPRAAMKALLEGIFACFPEAARTQAWSNLEHNGGLSELHLALFEDKGFYADGKTFAELDDAARRARPDPYFQVWRVEGPGTVVHFQGHPHVHAYLNVVREPAHQHVGEALARLEATLEGEALRAFVQRALVRATGAQAAYCGERVPGRLCAGEVTTGALWSLDPFDNRVAIATIRSEALAPELRAALAAQGIAGRPGAAYRVATSEYFANDSGSFGEPERIELVGTDLRELLVAHVRRHGLGAA